MRKKKGDWLCLKHAGTDKRWHLPGVERKCSKCLDYAYSYYEYKEGRYVPRVIMSYEV